MIPNAFCWRNQHEVKIGIRNTILLLAGVRWDSNPLQPGIGAIPVLVRPWTPHPQLLLKCYAATVAAGSASTISGSLSFGLRMAMTMPTPPSNANPT